MKQIFIEQLPKVELHIHLEGTLDESLIVSLAEKNGVVLPRPKEQLIQFTGLADFLELLNWICSLVQDEADARKIAYNYAQYASKQNIVYAEVITNPTHWKALSYERLIPSIIDGFEEAYRDGYCDCRLLISLLRSQTKQESLKLVRWMKEHIHPRLVGLSIDGNEAASYQSNRVFYEAFCEARKAGFGITVHAGESSPAEGVREALDLLGAMRIDHGVRAISDAKLLRRLYDQQIPLNITLTSNLTELYENAQVHPLNQFYQMGIPVTLSTDDPALLKIDLCRELTLASETYGWTETDLINLQKNAISACFCSEEEKSVLKEKLRVFCIACECGVRDKA